MGKDATAAACQEEVGCASSGRASGRPPDQIIRGSRNSLAPQATDREGHTLALDTKDYQDQPPNPAENSETDKREGEDEGLESADENELQGESDNGGRTIQAEAMEDVLDLIELRPEKVIRLPPHHRVWVPCRAPPGCKPNVAVLTDDEGLQDQISKRRGLSVRPTVNYIRKKRVHVLVENLSDISVRLNTSYVLAHGFPMVEPEVDWARGKYSHLHVLSILQQEIDKDQGIQRNSKKDWPSNEELASKGKDSWWDPCKGMLDGQREAWCAETFKLEENQYLKENPEILKNLNLLAEFTDVCAGKGHTEAIPMTTWVSLNLDLVPGSQTIHQRPRPLSPPDQDDLERQLAVWLKQRVIIPAVPGAYALNFVPVRKKGVVASLRCWTIDARPLNACTIHRPEFNRTVTANLENLEEFFPDEEEYYEILDPDEPKVRQVSEEYRRYYEGQTTSSSKDEEEGLDIPTGSTDTNLCTLPLMCVCLLGDIERKSRIRPEPLYQSQKHRTQLGDIILKEVMTWVGRGDKPRRQQLRGRPADLQAYWNVWELLKIKDGVLYRVPLEGGAEHLDKLRWCVRTNSVTDVLLVAHVEEGGHMAVESTVNRAV